MQSSSASTPNGAQADIPAEVTKSVTQVSALSPARAPTPPEDLYEYQKCTVMIVIQLRPQRQVDGSRARPVECPEWDSEQRRSAPVPFTFL